MLFGHLIYLFAFNDAPPALLYNDFIIRQRYHSMTGQHRLIALPSTAIIFYYKYDRMFFKFYHFLLSSPHLTCRWYDKKFTRVPYLHLYIFTWMNNPSDNPSTPILTPNFLVSPLNHPVYLQHLKSLPFPPQRND